MKRFHLFVYVLKLFISIGVFFANLIHFLVHLETVSHFLQKVTHLAIRNFESFRTKFLCEIPKALCCPAQRIFGTSKSIITNEFI